MFDYQVFDGNNAEPGLDTGTVTITITPDNNDPPAITLTPRNPTFFATNNSVDLYSNVTAVLEGSPSPDDADQLVLTVTNVTQGADEKLVVDGTAVELTNGNNENTPARRVIGVSVSGRARRDRHHHPRRRIRRERARVYDRRLRYQTSTRPRLSHGSSPSSRRATTALPTIPDAVAELHRKPAGLAHDYLGQHRGRAANLSSTLANQIAVRPAISSERSRRGPLRHVPEHCYVPADGGFARRLDTNDFEDVYLRDRVNGTTVRASLADDESQANGHSYGSSVSDDGARVVFISQATNLVAGDTNFRADVFLRTSGTTTARVNLGVAGAQDDGGAGQAEISGNGLFVAFTSTGTNLVATDTNGHQDIFLRNLTTNMTTLISQRRWVLRGRRRSRL